MANIKLNGEQIIPANWNDIQNKPSINVGEGEKSVIEGSETKASGQYSHAQGEKTIASGRVAYAEGYSTISSGNGGHAEGERTKAEGPDSHAQGYYTKSQGLASHAEGINNIAASSSSHAEGGRYRNSDQTVRGGGPNWAQGSASHAEGTSTRTGENAIAGHSEGIATYVTGKAGHAEGMGFEVLCPSNINVDTNGFTALDTNEKVLTANIKWWNSTSYHGDFVEPGNVLRLAERTKNDTNDSAVTAKEYNIFVVSRTGTPGETELQTITFIGELDINKKYKIISKFKPVTANGIAAHAEGGSTTASGNYSHAGGQGTIANGTAQTAIGKYNIADNNSLFIVGNGTSDTNRQNAFRVDKDGKAYDATGQLATTADIETAINNAKLEGSDITIDTELSDRSVNPVQNKVVKTAIDTITNRTNNIETDLQTLNEGSWHILTIEDINGETTTINFWGK